MTITIRSAAPDDISEIQDVARAAWHAAHGPIIGREAVEEFLDEYYGADTFRSKIEDNSALLYVAETAHDGILGFALAGPTDDSWAIFGLSRIYVAPDRWGEGVGQRLLRQIEQEISDRGGTKVKLGVMSENKRAVEFYEAAGYSKVNTFVDDRIGTRGYAYEKDL